MCELRNRINPSNTAVSFKHLNNEGVDFIQRGLYDEAIQSYIDVLRSVNEKLATTVNPSASSKPCLVELLGASFARDIHKLYSKPSNPEDIFIFENPIEISKDEVNSTNSCTELLIVAMYNLALSYHLSAIEHSDEQRLEIAMQYYVSAFQSLLDVTDLVASPAMAILNNMGHIHRLLQNDEKAKNCFQHLLNTMLFVQVMGEANRIRNWDDLFHNAVQFADLIEEESNKENFFPHMQSMC